MTAILENRTHDRDPQRSFDGVWLFSPSVDLWTFGGSAALALVLLSIGRSAGWTQSATPDWTWVTGVLLVDVAHVYATGFRVYFQPTEFFRRPWLYGLTPVLAAGIGWAIASESETLFWRLLAYLAVFHFVRQQAGWVAWYRGRAKQCDWASALVDYGAIYGATLYPLIYWHSRLPRSFWWFLEGDFVAVPSVTADVLWPGFVGMLLLYAVCAGHRYLVSHTAIPGKDLVVVTTAACWYLGIVAFNSDFAFTVTNVFIHGIPYLVLTYWYARRVDGTRWMMSTPLRTIPVFLATVWLLAYTEELLWDRGFWHERNWLFGPAIQLGQSRAILLSLLATPQITHYILDGFLWRRAGNPELQEVMTVDPTRATQTQAKVEEG